MNTEQGVAGEPQQEEAEDSKPSGRRALPDGAERHPLIDLSRDPNPGKPNHAKPEDDN